MMNSEPGSDIELAVVVQLGELICRCPTPTSSRPRCSPLQFCTANPTAFIEPLPNTTCRQRREIKQNGDHRGQGESYVAATIYPAMLM